LKKFILLMASGLFWFSLYVYLPYLTPDLIALGVTATLTGVIVAAHSFVQFLLRFPVGIKSEALGRQKPFVVAGMLFSAAASLIMYFFPSPIMLFAGNIVSGFASTTYVSFTVLYARYYSSDQNTRAMGIMGTAVEGGILCAFLVGGFAYDYAGIKLLFLIAVFVAAAGFVVSMFVKEEAVASTSENHVDIRELLKNRQLITSSILCILVKAVVFATAFSFTPKIAKDIGATGTQIGILNALFIGASVIGSYFITTKTGVKFGNRKTSVAGFILLSVYAAAIPFIHSVPLFMAVQFMGGLGYASLTSIFMANSVRGLPREKRPAGMGLYQAMYSIGSTVGPIILGIFADTISYSAGFFMMAAVAASGLATAINAGKKGLVQ